MAQKHTIGELKMRKHVLEERTDKENENIIKKINRKISNLARKRKHQGISDTIPVCLWEGDSNEEDR